MALKISQADDIVEVLSTDYFPISQNPAKNEKVRANQIKEYCITPNYAHSAEADITIGTVERNKIYTYGELTSLTLTTINSFDQATFIFFSSGATPTTLNIPNNTPHIGDLTIDASTDYVIGIFHGIITVKEVE